MPDLDWIDFRPLFFIDMQLVGNSAFRSYGSDVDMSGWPTPPCFFHALGYIHEACHSCIPYPSNIALRGVSENSHLFLIPTRPWGPAGHVWWGENRKHFWTERWITERFVGTNQFDHFCLLWGEVMGDKYPICFGWIILNFVQMVTIKLQRKDIKFKVT